MRYGIAINSKRCMACYACFMACKDEHCGWDTDLSKSQPEMGQYWMNIKEWERGDNERHIKTATVPTPCSHCDNPACVKAAKDGAAYKREHGGRLHRVLHEVHAPVTDSNGDCDVRAD